MNDIVALTAQLAAAHIGNNPTKAEEVPAIIASIGEALLKATQPAATAVAQQPKKRGPVETRKTRSAKAPSEPQEAPQGDEEGDGGSVGRKSFSEALGAARGHLTKQEQAAQEEASEAHPS